MDSDKDLEQGAEPVETLSSNVLSGNTFSEPTERKSVVSSAISVIDSVLVENFTPAFFASVMGTGISANIMSEFAYSAHWLVICSYIMFGFCCICLVTCTAGFVLSCVRHPEKWALFNLDARQSVFLGCAAMGFSTFVNYIYFLTESHRHGPIACFVLWWIAVALALYTVCLTFYLSYVSKIRSKHRQTIDLENHHSTLLLPVVTICVTSSSGNIVLPGLPTMHLKVMTLVITYVMWACGVTLAFMITCIYLHRLFLHKVPGTNMVFSMYLPIGFLGQASFAILSQGRNAFNMLQETGVQPHWWAFYPQDKTSSETASLIGSTLVICTGFAGLLLLSFGFFMTFLAVTSTVSKTALFTKNPNKSFTKHGMIKFYRGFWSMTFPLGTMTIGLKEFAYNFGDGLVFFRAMSAVYGTATVLVTIGCLLGCIHKFFRLMSPPVEKKS